MFSILFSEDVKKDLKKIPLHHRNRILDAIVKQLSHEPNVPARNKKILMNLVPPWDAVEPIWELRVGDYRVFYDVGEKRSEVYVRAVRLKPPDKTTEEIL